MTKIIVNTDQCIGCGACVGIDPEHFEFNDEGYSTVKNNENLESTDLQSAIESCPVQIISLQEDSCDCNDECHCNCEEQKN